MNVKLQEDFMNQFGRTEDMVVFLFLLLKADDEGKVTTSLSRIEESLGYGERVIRTSLANLQLTGKVTGKVTNKNRTITICDIDSYVIRKKVTRQAERQAERQATDTPQDDKELLFQKRMAEVYPNVAKLAKPLTLDQYNKYLEMYSNETIKETLLAMENCKDLAKKYISANLTLGKWLKNAIKYD